MLDIPAIENRLVPSKNMHRNVAMLPSVIIREAVKVAKITETDGQERLLAPVQAAQIGLVWRITRRKLSGNWASWVDIDPFRVPIDQGATPQSVRVAEAPSFCGKENLSTHPRLRRRIRVHTRRCWTHFRLAIIGIERESDRPTGFTLRRFRRFHTLHAENNQSSSFHRLPPQSDGSWLAKEIPGPTNYQAWLYCWRVFRVHEMPLDRYQRKIEKLATQRPTAWHLVCLAEDKCRFEHFNRLKSRSSSIPFPPKPIRTISGVFGIN